VREGVGGTGKEGGCWCGETGSAGCGGEEREGKVRREVGERGRIDVWSGLEDVLDGEILGEAREKLLERCQMSKNKRDSINGLDRRSWSKKVFK